MKIDNIHYSYRRIDGFNKPFNFILGPREIGKTSVMWFSKIYSGWKEDKRPWIYVTRSVVEITDALLTSIQDSILNKFSDEPITFTYSRAAFKDGIVDVKIGDELFFRVVALSIALRRIKLAVLANLKAVFIDEYIIDPKTNERYLTEEAFKIKEAYTTWRREAGGVLKVYITANPYSLYNPLFVDWGVDVSRLRKGEIYTGDIYAIDWAVINPELREKLLIANPLYKFDEDYAGYAIEGGAIHDKNIPLAARPDGYPLRHLIKIGNALIGIFQAKEASNILYHCEFVTEIGKSRTAFCTDISDIVENSQLLTKEIKEKLSLFKRAFGMRRVTFSDINVYYMALEVFKLI